jgi:ABC-type Fe3+/spermidine/putrescine transport system ATPase subunit
MGVTGSGARAPLVALEGVTRRFGEVTAVDDLSLALTPGEFVTLLGPSGCGKTTALRLLAGFEQADKGTLRFRGDDITRWTPQRRGFGMVFQNYALFPHLNVFENVAFGLKSRKSPPPDLPARVDAALARVDLAGYAERAVQALSGGQQQRVALARALAIEPPLLLLDEPLSNLDQALRVRTRTEIRALVRELGMTALFVTHDQEEAFDLSDRIAVMQAGRLRQLGPPRELYEHPADRFVAGFVGRVNELRVGVEEDAMVLPGGVRWPLPTGLAAGGAGSGSQLPGRGEAALLLRPEMLVLTPAGAGSRGGPAASAAGSESPSASTAAFPPLPGEVVDRRFGGAVTTWRVRVAGADEPLEVTAASVALGPAGSSGSAPDPAVGERVEVRPFRAGTGFLFPATDARGG